MIKRDAYLSSYFNDNESHSDLVEIKRVGNKLEVTPVADGPIHISAIRFENESATIANFSFSYIWQDGYSKDTRTFSVESGSLYLGQSKEITFDSMSPDSAGNMCPTTDEGIRVESMFNHNTCKQKWILDPNANLRAKYRATGSEFSLTLHYDSTEPVSPPVPTGYGDLKIVNTCGVSTEQGLLQQVVIQEDGKDYFSKTWDTHNASSAYHVGLKKGANYSIHMREVYNLAMPGELPVYVYINAYINIQNCQAHDGTLTLIGTGLPTGSENYTFDYNGKHYDYTQTLNISE